MGEGLTDAAIDLLDLATQKPGIFIEHKASTSCRRLDAAAEGVECFRVGVDRWEYFFNARKAQGYVERPLLGF